MCMMELLGGKMENVKKFYEATCLLKLRIILAIIYRIQMHFPVLLKRSIVFEAKEKV